MFSEREKIYQPKRPSRFSGINVFWPQIIQNVSIFCGSDELQFDPVLLLKSMGEYALRVIKSIILEARRRQHMRKHDENENFRSKKSSEW